LREKERLREPYRQQPAGANLEDLAAQLATQSGLDHETTLALLADIAPEQEFRRAGK